MSPERVIAVDWSGALSEGAQRRGIRAAVCEVWSGEVRLLPGMLRSEVAAWLVEVGSSGARVVAGLDFSFSLPGWFLRELGCLSAPALWELVALEGERWLREPHSHFWGRGSRRPAGHGGLGGLGYRRCEREVAAGRRLPSSSFQIGGAGAVGTGSLRGMPVLTRLREAGWRVWPFDPPGYPLLVEIYPRVLTGAVVKSSGSARGLYLRERFPGLAAGLFDEAAGSEDAFDALVSALVMREHAASFAGLTQSLDDTARLEGAIWRPGVFCG